MKEELKAEHSCFSIQELWALNGLVDLYYEQKENLKIATAMLTKGTYPEQNEGANDFNKQFICKGKILNLINERKFELQQEFKDFKDDVRLNTLQEIYNMEEK